jgi:hypothetical protein
MKKLKIIIWYKIKKYLANKRSKGLKKSFSGLKNNQIKIVEITNYLICSSQTRLIYSNLTSTFFMEYKDVICKIDDDRIIITNGLYSYDISINIEIIADLRVKFLNNLESKKRSTERKIIEKLSSSLGKVHEQIISLKDPKSEF